MDFTHVAAPRPASVRDIQRKRQEKRPGTPQPAHRLTLVVYMNMGLAGSGVLLLRSRAATGSGLTKVVSSLGTGWDRLTGAAAATSGEAAAGPLA